MKKKRISVILAWVLAGLGALSFLLPWVRPVQRSAQAGISDIVRNLATEEDNVFESWIGMSGEQWKAVWRQPTVGLSGFQILLLDSEEGVSAAESKKWLASVYGERGALGRMMNVLPVVILLVTAAFLSPRKPVTEVYVAGGALLFLLYLWARWKLGATDTTRVVAKMEICYGLWITLYTMLAMSILVLARFLNPKAKW